MSSLSTGALLAIFIGAALVTWVTGVRLAATTDVLDDHFGLGEAPGGMVLLSIVGSLPELAITISAAASGDLSASPPATSSVALPCRRSPLVIADRCTRGDRPLSAAAKLPI